MIFPEHKLICISIPKTASSTLAALLKPNFTPNHLSVFQVYDSYTPEVLDGYKIITTVRNPYDRFISAYEHMKWEGNLGGDFSISEKIQDLKNRIENSPRKTLDRSVDNVVWIPQSDFISIRGNVIADHIFRFENFNDDIAQFFESIPTIDLNKLENHQVGNYEKYELSDKDKLGVYELYKRDFELFGYSK